VFPASNKLSTRERECLHWVALGKTSWETGRILGLAERTVNFHIQNACRKLGVHGRQAAVTIALRDGLLTFEEAQPRDTKAAQAEEGSESARCIDTESG